MASALPDGYRRLRFDSLPSTNAAALAVARDGEPGGLWVTAAEQTEGRGRRGRGWTTDRGNLAASLMLIDPAPANVAPTLSFVAGVALHQAVIDVAGPAVAERLALKWPNDLLLDGLKVAGILIEGERLARGGFAVAVGIGVNCVAHPEVSNHPASDFARPRRAACVRGAVFGAWRSAWPTRSPRGTAAPGSRRRAGPGSRRATGVGSPIRVDLGERVVEGRFEAIDEAGRLVVGARQRYGAKR